MKHLLEQLEAGRSISVEVVPPSRGGDPDGVLACVEAVMPYGPAFVSVTDHPAGSAWAECDGRSVEVPLRGKPGTLGLCMSIHQSFDVPVVPHVVCAGNDRFRAEDELIDLRYAGFRDVFVVRGDCPPNASVGGDPLQAVDLVRLASDLNRGEYASGTAHGTPAGLSIGVAGYPEGHPDASGPDADMAALAAKVAAGATWIITQMVFEVRAYADFVARVRAAGIAVPVLPGVKPVTSSTTLSRIPGTFHVSVPDALTRALEDARTPADERMTGARYAADLAAGLLDAGAPCVHFFTMGRARDTVAALSALAGGKDST